MKIIKQNTKTLKTRDNSRSSDAIAPNFIYGCLGGCMKSYCYVSRYNNDKVYVNENIDQILGSISDWENQQAWPKEPNQVDDTYYCIDIGCSTDVPLHSKYYEWQKVFDYFNNSAKLKSTFATKYPSRFDVAAFNLVPGKHRIRISLMPQRLSKILEPNTDLILDRLKAFHVLKTKFEVHINFSPIVVYDKWLSDYEKLFKLMVSEGVTDFKAECIFMTYNEVQHKNNSDKVNSILWVPELQEKKNSEYAADNIRYKLSYKRRFTEDFIELFSEYFPNAFIRYIF
jgi:spore photoproduct lyase